VAREVGTEGKLGGQAAVQGVAGTWKDLTDNVNTMAMNVRSLLPFQHLTLRLTCVMGRAAHITSSYDFLGNGA
jgi:hypothetical protein